VVHVEDVEKATNVAKGVDIGGTTAVRDGLQRDNIEKRRIVINIDDDSPHPTKPKTDARPGTDSFRAKYTK
jgi:hypothetical protein